MSLIWSISTTARIPPVNGTLGYKQVSLSMLLGLCCLVGLPSNVAAIATITRQCNKKISFTDKLMLNLPVSDSLTLGLAPFVMYGLLRGWTFGLWPCRILTYLVYCAMYGSVLTVTLMAGHRYHTVKSKIPNQRDLERRQKGRRSALVIGLWGLAIIFAMPIFFTQSAQDKQGCPRCHRKIDSLSGKVTVLLLEVILGFVLPFSIILTSYCWINKTKLQGGQNIRKRKKKLRRLVISIVTAFFLFWTPVHIINVIDVATTLIKGSSPAIYAELKAFRRVTGDVSKTLAVINCCVNPFLYAFALKIFKKKQNKQRK